MSISETREQLGKSNSPEWGFRQPEKSAVNYRSYRINAGTCELGTYDVGIPVIEKSYLPSPQNVSKNSAVALRILKASHTVALKFHGL